MILLCWAGLACNAETSMFSLRLLLTVWFISFLCWPCFRTTHAMTALQTKCATRFCLTHTPFSCDCGHASLISWISVLTTALTSKISPSSVSRCWRYGLVLSRMVWPSCPTLSCPVLCCANGTEEDDYLTPSLIIQPLPSNCQIELCHKKGITQSFLHLSTETAPSPLLATFLSPAFSSASVRNSLSVVFVQHCFKCSASLQLEISLFSHMARVTWRSAVALS